MKVRDDHIDTACAAAEEAMCRLIEIGIDEGALAMAFLGAALDRLRRLDGPENLAAGLKAYAKAYDDRRRIH